MHILITGGTGFIGSALCQALVAKGHQLTLLTRQAKPSQQAVNFVQNLTNFDNLNQVDAVINLAGEPIFDKAWTTQQKQQLWDSRIQLTEKLSRLIQQSDQPPHIFLSGSATGFYGDLPASSGHFDELTPAGAAFPAQLCQAWEQVALQAKSEKTRVCLIRTGLVFDPEGGALKKMLPLYRFGLGGKLGSGKQHWAWISRQDHVRALCFLLENNQAQGAFNFVAPELLTNQQFNRQLAKALNRPAFFSVPAFALKWLLGERSQLLLDNQPLAPQRLLDLGFEFQDPSLAQWLSHAFS